MMKIEKKEIFKKSEIVKTNDGYRVVITKEIEDRDGQIIRVAGIDTSEYQLNPVVLIKHNIDGRVDKIVVGRMNRIEQGLDADGIPVLWGFVEFADTKEAKEVEQLVVRGFQKAVSMGFYKTVWQGNVCISCMLIEVSIVPIGANQEAVFKAFKDVDTTIAKYLDLKPRIKAYRELLMDSKLWKDLNIVKSGNEVDDILTIVDILKKNNKKVDNEKQKEDKVEKAIEPEVETQPKSEPKAENQQAETRSEQLRNLLQNILDNL